jgi:hypothetical protein
MAAVSRLLRRLRRRWPGMKYAWFREISRQGNEHVHLLLRVPAGGSVSSSAWFPQA